MTINGKSIDIYTRQYQKKWPKFSVNFETLKILLKKNHFEKGKHHVYIITDTSVND